MSIFVVISFGFRLNIYEIHWQTEPYEYENSNVSKVGIMWKVMHGIPKTHWKCFGLLFCFSRWIELNDRLCVTKTAFVRSFFFCNCCEYNNKYHVKDVHEIAKSNEHRMAKALLLRKQKNLRIEKYRHTIIVYIVLLSSCFCWLFL